MAGPEFPRGRRGHHEGAGVNLLFWLISPKTMKMKPIGPGGGAHSPFQLVLAISVTSLHMIQILKEGLVMSSLSFHIAHKIDL